MSTATSMIPLDIEPCSIEDMEIYLLQLKTELQNNEKDNNVEEEIEHVKSRIQYWMAAQQAKSKSKSSLKRSSISPKKTNTAAGSKKRSAADTESTNTSQTTTKQPKLYHKDGISYTRKRCSYEGCTNRSQKDGLCYRRKLY